MTRRQYAGGAARTTTSGSIASSGGGTVVIASVTGWPDGSVGKFHVVIDPGLSSEEKILVDSRTGTTLTFSVSGRGADESVATSHASGAKIWHCFTAQDADEANAHINQATASHTAAQISFAPTAGIAATTVQAAIAELENEAADARLDLIEANNWVTQARMADASVGTAEMIDANVTTAKVADSNVTTAKIADGNVTYAKLAPVAVSRWSRNTIQTMTTSTEVVVSWTAENEDDLSMATPTFTVITMPSGSDGWWGVDLNVNVNGSIAASGYLQMTVNGTFIYRTPNAVLSSGYLGVTWGVYLVATDTLDFRVFNGSGGSINITSAVLKMARLAKIA